MFSGRRGPGRRVIGALTLALLAPALVACAPAAGGAVLVAVVAIGALTTHCYDYIDVSVFDAHGHKTCAATVSASDGSEQFELKSCYYAPLTDGHWTVRASLPGLPAALSTVDVDHANDCTRHVQSLELTLNPAASAAATAMPGPAPPQLPPAAEPAPPPPPLSPSAPENSAPAPPSAAPTTSPTPASSAAPPTAVPPASAAPPSVGAFPDTAPRPGPPK